MSVKVPVAYPGPGILHKTDYAKGAISWEAAEQDHAEAMAKLGHTRWAAAYYMGEVQPFTASLRLVDSWRHASSVYFTFEDENGVRWPMLFGDAAEFFKHATMVGGRSASYTFEVVKRGQSYGIRRVQS